MGVLVVSIVRMVSVSRLHSLAAVSTLCAHDMKFTLAVSVKIFY